MRIISSIFIFLAGYSLVFGQASLEERLLEERADGSDQSELMEIIMTLKENPINLNTASLQELETLPDLTAKQRRAIINHRKALGRYKSIQELLAVPEIDLDTYNTIRELITTETPKAVKLTHLQLRTRVVNRLDEPTGFQNGAYDKSSEKVYNRLRFTLGTNMSGGILLEKDAGESNFGDLGLFYLTAILNTHVRALVGHFNLELGQGLVLWGPYGLAKSSATVFPVKKNGRGIRGYTSVDENAAFFGGALSATIGGFEIVSFVSQNKLDATLVSDEEVSSLGSTGFHRTQPEKERKDALTESATGGRILYTFPKGFTIGATILHTSFDKTIQNPDFIRNRFKFRGRENNVGGFDWSWGVNDVRLFGEVARSKSAGKAILAGAILDLDAVQLAILYRNYDKDFQNMHAFGFGESNGTTQNERGYYFGLNYKASSTTNIRAAFDIFSSPWRTFFEPLPVEGNEVLLQVEQKLRGNLNFTVRFRSDNKSETADFPGAPGRSIAEFVRKTRRQVRLQLDYRVSRSLELRNRLEYTRVTHDRFSADNRPEDENGFLIYQNVKLTTGKKLHLQGRLAFFDSDSFDSRVFQYENDLPGVVTNRALFGRGSRWYLLMKYQPTIRLAMYLKYSETFRDDVEVIGSGPDQIEGNLDRRLNAQLEIRL